MSQLKNVTCNVSNLIIPFYFQKVKPQPNISDHTIFGWQLDDQQRLYQSHQKK